MGNERAKSLAIIVGCLTIVVGLVVQYIFEWIELPREQMPYSQIVVEGNFDTKALLESGYIEGSMFRR